jgi:uncharacterized protein (TIGR00251 family)
MPAWLTQNAPSVAQASSGQARSLQWRLHLHIQPNARTTEVVGEHGAALKIRLQAPPVDGKANQALLKWLAKQLGLRQAQLTLISGELAREKVIGVWAADCTEAAILEALRPAQ